MKLVIISHEPFRMKMRDDFYMEQFKADGYMVSYWCVQRVLGYSSKSNYLHYEDSEDVRYFDRHDELTGALKMLEEDSVVCLDIWFVEDTAEILSLLMGLKVKLFKIDYFRNQPVVRSARKKLTKSIKSLDFKRIIGAVLRKFKQSIFEFRLKLQGVRLDFPVFIPGCLASCGKERIISITHFDVYSYEKSLESDQVVDGCYYVFIDIFLPYHPDIIRGGSESVEPATYFKTLRNLFDDIERQTGHQVVIAAHPKSKYKDEFGERLCLYNQAPALIKHAEGVLSHHSAAINFAVLAYKPLILLSSKAFTETDVNNFMLENMYDIMRGYQIELDSVMVDMERGFDLKALKPVKVDLYDRFKLKYLYSSAFPKSNYEIIIEELDLNGAKKLNS